MTLARSRVVAYVAKIAALFAGFRLLRGSDWQGSAHLHMLMEVVATALAAIGNEPFMLKLLVDIREKPGLPIRRSC